LVAVRDHILDDYADEFRSRLADLKRADWWASLDRECVQFINFIIELGELHGAIFHGPIAQHPINDERSATNRQLLHRWLSPESTRVKRG
jgi:hypothetical protein